MDQNRSSFRDGAFFALRQLAKDHPVYEDAQMLVGAAEAEASLYRQSILKSIDTDWIEAIEQALPALDAVIRNPAIAMQEVEEVLPVELSRHINDRSVKHLAQHTNLIQDIKGDEVIPQKILNVWRDESYLTYENKFINTLLSRLSAFVDKRYRALADGRGAEQKYRFDYATSFEHRPSEDGGKNAAQIRLSIELTSPLAADGEAPHDGINQSYEQALSRIHRIDRALRAYRSSAFAEKLGRAYIRPPVIRTNAILKNKNMKECLTLWEYIESFDKVGYAVQSGSAAEMPPDSYIQDLYSTVALQYVHFYEGVTQGEENRLLSKPGIMETEPAFATDLPEQEEEDYLVYDTEYRKLVPVSRLMNNRKKLSPDERRIAMALDVALRADAMIEEARRAAEEEARRAEEEARRREEARRAAEEAARRAEEEARQKAEEEAARQAEEEARRQAAARQAEEEARARRAAEEARARHLAEKEAEVARLAEEAAALERASETFMPEDGDLTGRYPLCPYTKAQYLALPRKKKKRIKQAICLVAAYRDAQQLLQQSREAEEKEALLAQCAAIRCDLPQGEAWQAVLAYHTV